MAYSSSLLFAALLTFPTTGHLQQGQQAQPKNGDQTLNQHVKEPGQKPVGTVWTFDDWRPSVSDLAGRFTMSLRARLQVDTAVFDQMDNVNSVTSQRNVQFKDLRSGVIARRAYLGVEGRAFTNFWYEYRMDFAGTKLALAEPIVNLARISYSSGNVANPAEPHVRINAGLIKPIFTYDDSTSSAALTFLERADVVNVATTGYGGGAPRLGIELTFQQSEIFHTGDNLVISGALTGQNPVVSNTTHEGTQLLGRVAYRLWSDGFAGIQIGGSASRILKVGDSTAASGARIVTLQDQPEIRVDNNHLTSTGDIQATGGALWGLEVVGNLRNFYISGEYYRFHIDRDMHCAGCIAAAAPEFSGWYVQASWILTGESKIYQPNTTNNGMATFSSPRVLKPLSFRDQTWGAWEIAARYSDLDLNWHQSSPGVTCTGTFVGCVRGGEQKIWTVGINWYLNNNLRLLFDYMIIDVDKLNSSGQQLGQKFKAIGTRLQFTN